MFVKWTLHSFILGKLTLVAQLDARLTGNQEVGVRHLGDGNIPSWRFDHEIFSMVILSLPLIQEWQLSLSDERLCTILLNRIEN